MMRFFAAAQNDIATHSRVEVGHYHPLAVPIMIRFELYSY
jgi:hypothetical protein